MNSQVSALVIGGGISGLVCAYTLRKRGIDAQIIEASARPGGVIRSERHDGFLLELGPQSFSATAALLQLCGELNIENELVQAPAQAPRYVLVDGALRQVRLGLSSLLTPSLLSLRTKWSIARDAFGRTEPPSADESIANFVRRKFTPELLDRLVGPFVSGVYAGDPERLSMRSAFPQVCEAEKSAGSVIRGLVHVSKPGEKPRTRPTLFSFREGNEVLVRALAANLGSALCCGTHAIRVVAKRQGSDSRFEITIARSGQQQVVTADRLIVATSADTAGRLLDHVNPAFESLLSPIEHAPVAIISLGYRRADVTHSLEGFGFLVPRSAGLRVLGTVWNSSLFPGRAPQDYVLLTNFVGGATDPEAIALSPEGLVATVHREIAPLLGIREKPVLSNVQTYARALPQYNLGHAERLASVQKLLLETAHLRLAGNYLRGPSIGACVEQALAAAEAL